MAIFHHSFTDIENYPIVSPFSLIISFNNPTKDHSLHWGAKAKKDFSKGLQAIKCLMLEGKCEENRVPIDVELIPLENRNEQEKNKDNEKGTKRNKKNEKNERWMKGQWKMIFHEMILGLITLKHSLGLLILSFETLNPGLHYVPKKSILIERGYLDWRVSSLRKFFCNQQGCCLFSSAKILDKPFTYSRWIFECIIRQSKNENGKCDSRVKTRKGSLEQKQKFWRLTGGANERMKGQRPDSIRSLYEVLYPFQNQKIEPSVPKCFPLNSRVYHGWSWRLSNCHI